MQGQAFINELLGVEINYDPGLVVGMVVLFDDGSGPAQVGGVIPMTNITDTLYVATFTPLVVGVYYFAKRVYTDNTFTTIDDNYARNSESIQAISSSSSLTPTDLENIENAVWDAPISEHTDPNTFGERNNVLITQPMADNLDNLDIPITDVTTALDNDFISLSNDIANVQTTVDTLATPGDVAAITASLATGGEVAGVQDTVDTILAEQLSATQVWSFPTRTLTAPVDTTVDLTGIARTTDVTTARDATIAALNQWAPKLVVAIDPLTNTGTLMSWLELNGQVHPLADSSSVNIYDANDTLVMAVGPDQMVSSHGIFSFTRANANLVLQSNNAYTCDIMITVGVTTYTGFVPITVF